MLSNIEWAGGWAQYSYRLSRVCLCTFCNFEGLCDTWNINMPSHPIWIAVVLSHIHEQYVHCRLQIYIGRIYWALPKKNYRINQYYESTAQLACHVPPVTACGLAYTEIFIGLMLFGLRLMFTNLFFPYIFIDTVNKLSVRVSGVKLVNSRLTMCLSVSQQHTLLQIVMRFGINVCGTKVKRCTFKSLYSLPVS